ncbi:MAG: thiol:disulfide interchange protein DsbA/DsbL [Magnetococcales bacterium]|nr:thiol:disulfide interchange protein DsbA/DsbL [Magnetococcales bacterium]
MRHIFSLLRVAIVFFLTGGLGMAVAAPPAETLQAGIHYDLINPVLPRSETKPEIVEIFNFKCPHCFALAPYTTAWAEKNKDRFLFKSVPVYWDKQTDIPARAFFAADFLGKGEAMKTAIFKAFFDRSIDIENREEMTALAQATGMEIEAFRTHMNSFGVSARLAQAKSLQQTYQVSATPTLVVNGKYRILPGKHAKGTTEPVDYDKLFKIIETLATQ